MFFRWHLQIFGDFCPKIFFTLVKKKLGPKNQFLAISQKIQFLVKNLMIKIDSL